MSSPSKMEKEPSEFFKQTIKVIRSVPKGRVATYGQIAKLAGSPHAARTVVWILHSSSGKYKLPWHRIINAKGKIALKDERGKTEQWQHLENEGIEVNSRGEVDLKEYLWVKAKKK